MGRPKRLDGIERRWAGDAESVWSGLADWRAAHPKATFSEIEAALDEADLALASATADVREASGEARPRCERCGVMLRSRGQSERKLLTQGGAEVPLLRTYIACPQCGDGSFPPGR